MMDKPLVFEQVAEAATGLSPLDKVRLVQLVMATLGQEIGREEKKPHQPLDEPEPTEDEITELLANLGKRTMTGREIVEAGLVGGWEHKGITDSVEWLTMQRRKRREKFSS